MLASFVERWLSAELSKPLIVNTMVASINPAPALIV